MTESIKAPRPVQAVNLLRTGHRQEAIDLLRAEMAEGPAAGERYRSIAMLAGRIGEVDMMLEASRRFARTQPEDLGRLLQYWGDLAANGQSAAARAAAEQWEAHNRPNPWVDHALGTMASAEGDFDKARERYRSALATGGDAAQNWFALAMITTFRDGADIDAMRAAQQRISQSDTQARARLHYAVAKGLHDLSDFDGAWAAYRAGAKLRSGSEPYSGQQLENLVASLIADFDAAQMGDLRAPAFQDVDVVMVNGLPRSGSTLIEQILTRHSQVPDGGESNLFRAASLPTVNFSLKGARAYQERHGEEADPWGLVAQTYARIMRERFPQTGTLVDKTLLQSHLMGLILHALPQVPIVWMRRDPLGNAVSCFRTYFTTRMAWSWSPEDIAHFFRQEDALFAHWTDLAGDRILVVPYEGVVDQPRLWIEKIAAHCNLPFEPAMLESHLGERSISTASVSQVRQPINRAGIGVHRHYPQFVDRFESSYRR